MHERRRLIRLALLLLYAVSGALALVYEIAWARRLALVFGSSHLASATGLVAFIGGLALGARTVAGHATRSAAPLRLYAMLEILIGLFGIASPWILDGIQALYLATWPNESAAGIPFVLYRCVMVAVALVVPTAMMGATVPVMTRVFERFVAHGTTAFALPLGANTLGAVVGTLLSGFVLLPALGLRGTLFAAGVANVIVGVAAFTLARREHTTTATATPTPSTAPPPKASPRLALLVAATTGACGLGLEIAWTRLLALVLGSTTYAFTLMLGAYLFGLAAGTLLASRFAATTRAPIRAAAVTLVVFGASAWAGIALANELPFWFLDLFRRVGDRTGGVFLAQAAIAAAIMVVPATASGIALPLAMRLAGGDAPGTTGGRLYALNTAAGIVAAILSTFVLIPALSLRVATMTLCAVLGVAALLVALRDRGPGRIAVAALSVALLVAIPLATPAFRPALFATAVYRYADRYATLSRPEFEAVRNPATSPVLYDEDGFVARVTVLGPAHDPALLLDGKGASAGGDIPTEILLAQLPMLLARGHERVLVIGHGAGVTAQSALVHADVTDVVSIELERKVLDCGHFFRAAGAPPDPRLHLVENDGRNYLLATQQSFDVICSQPSNPWVSGAAPLFTAEAYRAGARRLRPGGVFCQWLQTYEVSEDNLRVLIRTFAREFPHVALMTSTAEGHIFLLGSHHPIRLPTARMDALTRGALGVEMRRARVEAAPMLLGLFCFQDADLRAFAGEGPLNTDDNARIEFALPFDLFTNRAQALHAALRRDSRGLPAFLEFPDDVKADARAAAWANYATAFRSMKLHELSKEALAASQRQ